MTPMRTLVTSWVVIAAVVCLVFAPPSSHIAGLVILAGLVALADLVLRAFYRLRQ